MPVVLSASKQAYSQTSDDQLNDIPQELVVERCCAVDTTRHLSVRGRYLRLMALPDPWVSWALTAVPRGLAMIRQYRPKVIWSTYPIATAHVIGYALHRITGLPWIADFRDPMIEVDPHTGERTPSAPSVWWARKRVECLAVRNCAKAVFVAPGAQRLYMERYADVPKDRWVLIGNGYDESHFMEAERIFSKQPMRATNRPILLLHSGILYPGPDRDPSEFCAAIASLRIAGKVSPMTLRVRFRASGYESRYRAVVKEHGVEDMIAIEPPIPYRDALAEMLSADGLLVFQGYTSNPAIPAKVYEYLRARRPIFALVDVEGDTAEILRAAGVGTIAPLDKRQEIARQLLEFLGQIRTGTGSIATWEHIRTHARESKAAELAALMRQVC
jgi:glycosyltransferase involved in cell wall biosynthesis